MDQGVSVVIEREGDRGQKIFACDCGDWGKGWRLFVVDLVVFGDFLRPSEIPVISAKPIGRSKLSAL